MLGNCKKLADRLSGPFEVLNGIGHVAYELALPLMIKIHNVFHVSLLNKDVYDPDHILNWSMIQVELEGEFQAQPVCILDKRTKTLQNRAIG